jgi:hypothetical protein
MAFSVIAVSIRVSPFAGELERRARARRVLEEQVDHGAAAQAGALLDRPAIHLDIGLGGIEQQVHVVGTHALDGEQMAMGEDRTHGEAGL